jgi:hypothetical protein
MRKQRTITPVLVMPSMKKPFSIFYDASGQSLGCLLMQGVPVVAYASWQLRKREEHYLTPDLELAVVVHALKIWKYFFMQLDFNFGQRRKLELIEDIL